MTAKEYLSQAFLLDKRITAKERQLESLKAHAAYVSPQITGMPKNSPSQRSFVEETAIKIADLENWIRSQIDELVRLRREIADAISAINHPEYEPLLEMRYLSFMSWEEIATTMDISLRYVFKQHNKALELVHFPGAIY